MSRHQSELTDAQWVHIAPLLPEPTASPKGGPQPIPNRPVFEGILWVLRSGARWKDLPERYPSPSTCWRRLRDWEAQDIWLKAWRALLKQLGKQPGPDRTWPCLMPPIGGLKRWPPEEASGVFPQIEWLQQPELLCSTLFLFLILYISPDHLRIQPDRIYTIPRRPEMITPIGFLLPIRKLPKDSNRSPAFHRPQ